MPSPAGARRRSRTEVQPGPNAPLVSGAAVAAASELYVRRTSSTADQPGWARSRSSWTKLDVGGRPYIWVWPTVIGGGAPVDTPASASATWIEAFDTVTWPEPPPVSAASSRSRMVRTYVSLVS